MSPLETLRQSLPDTARDIKVNLGNVLQPGVLSSDQRWGVAVAAALTSRHAALSKAILEEASAQVGAFSLPANSKDAAILVTLEPGAYTAQVSGVGSTTGTALIEIYEVL